MAYAHTKVKPCNCPAYKHPHRLDGGECKALYNSGSNETYQDYRKEIVRDFDRVEASAINLDNNRGMK